MREKLEYSVLTRLLTLNTQVHDLENQLMTESVPRLADQTESIMTSANANRIAEMQDLIAQGVRASLTTCWLSTAEDLDF